MLNGWKMNRPQRATLVVCAMFVLMAMGTTVANAALVAYLPFDQENRNITPELQNGFNGTFINQTHLDPNIAPQLAANGPGLAARFDGTDDRVDLNGNGGFVGITGNAARSFSFWINHEGGDNDNAVFSYGTNTNSQKWVTRTNSNAGNGVDGAIRSEINGGFEIGTTPLRNAGWHHVAITWQDDGTNSINDAIYYVDGVLDPSTTIGGNNDVATSAANILQIGNDRFSGTRDWNGMIDDFAVFDHVLTASDAAGLAAGTLSPSDFLFNPKQTVFRSGFEYENGAPTPGTIGTDAANLNGADGQIGTFRGTVPGADDGSSTFPDLMSIANANGGGALFVDRASADGAFFADFETTIDIDGAEVIFDLGTRRTIANRAKDYDIVGFGHDGEEAFHLRINTENTPGNGAGDTERISVIVDGMLIDDLTTIFGDDMDEDLENVNTQTPGTGLFSTILLNLTDDGYTITFDDAENSYVSALIGFNGNATRLSNIMFTFAGGATDGETSGYFLDNLSVRGTQFVPEPTTALLALMGLGGVAMRRRRAAA